MFYNDHSCNAAIDDDDVKLDNAQEFRNYVKLDSDNNKILIIYTSYCESITKVEVDSYN